MAREVGQIVRRLRHSGENTLVCSAKVPHYPPQNRGPVQGIDIRLRASCPRANRSGYAYCDEDAHFARRQAFGLDYIDSPTHYVEHAAKTLFLVLVTLTEQKWVTLAERRGAACEEMLGLQPKAETVAVKRLVGTSSTLSLSHAEANAQIQAAAR